MFTKPMILPLDIEGKIYALQDKRGNTIGTGTREVCEVLMYIITKRPSPAISGKQRLPIPQGPNVRAAILYSIWGRAVIINPKTRALHLESSAWPELSPMRLGRFSKRQRFQ
jgi:hypothetical protein